MHEMGIAMQIIEIATESIPEDQKGVQVEKINLKIGKLSNVVPDSLTFCFEIASKDTAVDGAILSIENIPVHARCKECSAEWTVEKPVFKCTACGSGQIKILAGQEMDISSIELAE